MKVDVVISADHIKKGELQGKVAVVIDMLRATSVMVTALDNGAKKVVPFLTVEEAFDYSKQHDGEVILGGERKALKIEGFDFSNSPLEYKREFVEGKTLAITTSNGTRAIKGCDGASHIFIAAMLNAKAICKKLKSLNEDVVIVNSGTMGQFSMDDFICAGYLIDTLINDNPKIELSDIAITAKYIYENNKDIDSFIKNARHYNILKSLGLDGDLHYCMKKGIIDNTPEYIDGEITI